MKSLEIFRNELWRHLLRYRCWSYCISTCLPITITIQKQITLWLFSSKAVSIKLLNVFECQKYNGFNEQDFGFCNENIKIFTAYVVWELFMTSCIKVQSHEVCKQTFSFPFQVFKINEYNVDNKCEVKLCYPALVPSSVFFCIKEQLFCVFSLLVFCLSVLPVVKCCQ